MSSPLFVQGRLEHHWFCARRAASPLWVAPWLGCSVADTPIGVSLDAPQKLTEGCVVRTESPTWDGLVVGRERVGRHLFQGSSAVDPVVGPGDGCPLVAALVYGAEGGTG